MDQVTGLSDRSVDQIADALLQVATATEPDWADDIALVVTAW